VNVYAEDGTTVLGAFAVVGLATQQKDAATVQTTK
jgi:hypothetical protein